MRILMWFTLGFSTICCLGAYNIVKGMVIPAAVAGLLLLGGIFRKRFYSLRVLPVIAVGILAGSILMSCFEKTVLAPALSYDGEERFLTIIASDYSYNTGFGLAVDGKVDLAGRSYQIRAYLDVPEDVQEIFPGDEITGLFRLRTTVPGGTEESEYHQSKGIFLIAYSQNDATIMPGLDITIWEYPSIMTRRIMDLLKDVFPEDVYPFAKALLLGDSYDLDYPTDTALKLSGIRHIIAVSGMHVSILYGAIASLTRRKPWLTAIFGIPTLVIFAMVAGFTPSVMRACIMVALMMLAQVFRREYDAPTALSFACLAMLGTNPLIITSVSFQLSVLCVAGILLFREPVKVWIQDKLPEKKRWSSYFASGTAISIGAMSLVTPLSAHYFGTVSLISVVTNLLTLWIVSGIFVGIIVVCLISFISVAAATSAAWILAWPIRFVIMIAKICAAIPFGAVYTASVYVIIWLLFCYCLVVQFILQPKQKPGKLISVGAIALCLALMLSYLEPLGDEVRITMLDVGQGQSILLQSKGKNFLVDCGGDSDTETADIIAENLLSQGISRLDGIIVTHYDRDHSGALKNLLTRMKTDVLILPDTPNKMQPAGGYEELIYLWDTTEIAFDDGKITVFGPIFHGQSNENSLCVLFETEKCDILITGDRTDFGERMLMRKAALPDVDILVAGHHGAESSSSEELLQMTKPEVVLISVGEDNFYGHPNPKLLKRLYDAGITVRRTDLEGNIIIRR